MKIFYVLFSLELLSQDVKEYRKEYRTRKGLTTIFALSMYVAPFMGESTHLPTGNDDHDAMRKV